MKQFYAKLLSNFHPQAFNFDHLKLRSSNDLKLHKLHLIPSLCHVQTMTRSSLATQIFAMDKSAFF